MVVSREGKGYGVARHIPLTHAGPHHATHSRGRQVLDVFAYFVLMSWFANLYPGLSVRARFAAGFIALGVVLEFVQLWTGYRSFEVADMTAGALGVAAGWIAAPPRLPNYLSFAERFWRSG